MPTHLMHTHTAEAIQEVEEFVLERFQQNLVRSLTDIDGSSSPFFDVSLHLGVFALPCYAQCRPEPDSGVDHAALRCSAFGEAVRCARAKSQTTLS
jgi:hypothetical protein